MRPAEKQIHNLLLKTKRTTRPELDEKILGDCLIELQTRKFSNPAPRPNYWRIIMQSRITKSAAAAIIVIVGFLSLTLFDTTVAPAYAIEQTVEAMKSVYNLRMRMAGGENPVYVSMQINPQTGKADHLRMEGPQPGDITITIPGQTYMYNKQKNEVTFLPQELLTNDLNFKDPINSLIEQTNAVDGRLEILNKFSDLAGRDVISVTILRKDESTAGQFLIDPKTSLPIYLGIGTGDPLNYMGPIEYNVDLPKDTFEFTIPKGVKVTDTRPEELKSQKPQPAQPVAFDLTQSAAALLSARNVHGIWIDRKGRRVHSWGLLEPMQGKVTKARMEYEDGGLYIMADGKTYFEDDGMTAIKDGWYFNVGVIFKNFVALAAQQIGDQGMMTVQKQFSEEFGREVIFVDVERPWVHLKAVVDPQTKRPIKFSIPMTTDLTEPLDYTELIEYDVDIPKGFFDIPTGPEVLVLGNHLDTQFANDPNFGIIRQENEDVQQVCQRIAKRYLQAKIDRDIETIKHLHPIHINRYGSNKMIEKSELEEVSSNGQILEMLEFKPAYEYRPRQMMVPCNVIKDYYGRHQEILSGVGVYLHEHEGQKYAVIIGYYPRLNGNFKVTPKGADLHAVTYDGLVPGAMMQKWLVLGPVAIQANAKVQRAAFETNHLDPAAFKSSIDVDSKSYQWRLLANESGFIDLTRPFGTLMGMIYLWAQIEMPQETTLVLGIGSDDAVKVWLNGELVHENWISRNTTLDSDRVPVTFKKGTNHLVLKIQNQGGGPWGFCCRRLAE